MQLFGSGPILNEALRAQEILAEKYQIAADVWSVTSYTELRREAIAIERWNRLHPAEAERKTYLETALAGAKGPIIAASDYMKALPDVLAPWLQAEGRCRLVTLGTDGFGRSDNRAHLRRHFEVNAEAIAGATLARLAREGKIDGEEGSRPRSRSWGSTRGQGPGAGVMGTLAGAASTIRITEDAIAGLERDLVQRGVAAQGVDGARGKGVCKVDCEIGSGQIGGHISRVP